MTRTTDVSVLAYDGARSASKFDSVVTEEPLELRAVAGTETRTLAVTMRTPGNDFELAAGFALGEGLLESRNDLAGLTYCVDREVDREQRFNIVNVELRAASLPQMERFERHFTMTSSCGICGRATIEALEERIDTIAPGATVDIDVVHGLAAHMQAAQRVFAATGGLHAAALFETGGTMLVVREDIGRHNAVDKVTGWAMMEGRLPLSDTILMVSGRASYEIVQKAAVARIPIVCSVSAPSSLAIDLARRFNVTLIGFVRGERANVYTAAERVTAMGARGAIPAPQ